MKTIELSGAALDWAVAKCEQFDNGDWLPDYSTDWAHGGPIIERERICVVATPSAHWDARTPDYPPRYISGETPLIAAMRCYVVSKLGDEVEIPEAFK